MNDRQFTIDTYGYEPGGFSLGRRNANVEGIGKIRELCRGVSGIPKSKKGVEIERTSETLEELANRKVNDSLGNYDEFEHEVNSTCALTDQREEGGKWK